MKKLLFAILIFFAGAKTYCQELSVTIEKQDVLCYGQAQGYAIATASGGFPEYDYLWCPSAGSQTSRFVLNLSAGTYSVTVTDQNASVFIASVTIEEPNELALYMSSSPAVCGSDLGTAFVSVAGGSPPYFYLWSGGTTSPVATNLYPGNYSVTVEDDYGCEKVMSTEIGIEGGINANIVELNPVLCHGSADGVLQAASSDGVAPLVFNWNNGAYSSLITGLGAGSYNVTVTDAWGCTGGGSFVLTQPEPFNIQTTGDRSICPGMSAEIGLESVTGGVLPYVVVNWNNDYVGNSITVSPLETTTYTVTVVDSNNCESDETEITVTVNPAYEFVTQETVCEGDSIYWRGNWYSTGGSFEENYFTNFSCDSSFVLELSVLPLPQQYTVCQIPSDGILPAYTSGQISLSGSETGVVYYVISNGQIVSGEIEGTNSTLELGNNFSAGIYEIMSRNAESSCELLQATVIFEDGNAINTISNKNYKLYPNPADETLYFENIPENTGYKVFDTKGNLIDSGIINGDKINVDNYASGSYVIVLSNEIKEIFRNKFIVE